MLTQQREKLVPGRREENCWSDDLAVQMAGGLGAAWVLGQGLAGNPFGALLFIPIEVGSKVISPNFHSCFFSSPSSQLTILQSLLPLGFPCVPPSFPPTAPALVKFKSCCVGVVTSQPLSHHPLSTVHTTAGSRFLKYESLSAGVLLKTLSWLPIEEDEGHIRSESFRPLETLLGSKGLAVSSHSALHCHFNPDSTLSCASWFCDPRDAEASLCLILLICKRRI